MNKSFRIGDLFAVEDTWVYGKNKQYNSRLDNPTSSSVAVVSGITVNNGINYYTEDILDESEIYSDCLTISTRGEYSGTVFYHDYPFVLANNILVMPMPNLSREAKLYIATLLNKLSYGGYNHYPKKDTLKEDYIELPVIENSNPDHEYTVDDIDWQYMRERIAELERERITELDAYLIAAGLDNYELTDEDKEILSSSTMQMFKEFDLSVLFDISTTKSADKNKLDFADDGEYDFIGRTSVNWGIQGKLHKLSFEPNPKDSFSLVQVGETVALWREKEWYASQNLFLLNPKIDEVKENKLYFQGVINKEMSRYGKEYSSYPTMKSLTATKILLPVIESPDPDHEYTPADIDWQYMKRYIRATEKLSIADVAMYKDRMIAAAKQVINI